MTVRLAQDIGMDKVAEMANRLGVMKNLPHLLSMSLGSGDTRLIDMVTAYSSFVNGGMKVQPYLIEQIQDRYGKSLYKNNDSECIGCKVAHFDEKAEVPEIMDTRKRVLDELTAYQMVSILQGVAIRGTGARLASLNKNLAGKTGTTNENKDAWFIGFSPDLVVGVYVGFDEPRIPLVIIPNIEEVHFDGMFDFASIAQSPNYTPENADYILDVFREYIEEI